MYNFRKHTIGLDFVRDMWCGGSLFAYIVMYMYSHILVLVWALIQSLLLFAITLLWYGSCRCIYLASYPSKNWVPISIMTS